MRELKRGANVARRKNPRVRRLQTVVDLDALLVELDAGHFETKLLDVRRTADGDEELIHVQLVVRCFRSH